MRSLVALLALTFAVLAATSAAFAQSASPGGAAALDDLFSKPIARDVFSKDANPTPAAVDNVNDAVKGLVRALGPLANITPDGEAYELVFAHGSAHATLTLDSTGKISSVYFRDAEGPALTAALNRVFRADKVDPAWFADSFLKQVTPSIIDSTFAQMHAQYGALKSIDPGNAGYVCTFERGKLSAQIMFGADGKIFLLQVHPAQN